MISFHAFGIVAFGFSLFTTGMSAQVAAIQGDAMAIDGSAIKGAAILIEREDLTGHYIVKTDTKGHYAHRGLPLGRYTISLVVNGETVESVEHVRTRLGDPLIVNFDLKNPRTSQQSLPQDPSQIGLLVGLYVTAQDPANQLQLNADGSFWLIEKGQKRTGNFTVEGDKLMIRVGRQLVGTGTVQGDRILDNEGQTWVRQVAKETPMAEPSPPPPPPSDAPVTKTIEQEQSTAQVVAALGQPMRIVKLGPKEIYFYKDLKVTFTNGKVTDVE